MKPRPIPVKKLVQGHREAWLGLRPKVVFPVSSFSPRILCDPQARCQWLALHWTQVLLSRWWAFWEQAITPTYGALKTVTGTKWTNSRPASLLEQEMKHHPHLSFILEALSRVLTIPGRLNNYAFHEPLAGWLCFQPSKPFPLGDFNSWTYNT